MSITRRSFLQTTGAATLAATQQAESAARGLFDIAREQRTLGSVSTVALLNVEQTYLQAQLAVVGGEVSAQISHLEQHGHSLVPAILLS